MMTLFSLCQSHEFFYERKDAYEIMTKDKNVELYISKTEYNWKIYRKTFNFGYCSIYVHLTYVSEFISSLKINAIPWQCDIFLRCYLIVKIKWLDSTYRWSRESYILFKKKKNIQSTQFFERLLRYRRQIKLCEHIDDCCLPSTKIIKTTLASQKPVHL